MSFIFNKNKSGPIVEPWGAPSFIIDVVPLILIVSGYVQIRFKPEIGIVPYSIVSKFWKYNFVINCIRGFFKIDKYTTR